MKITNLLHSYNRLTVGIENSHDMVNGFGFYSYNGKDFVVVALNSWGMAIKSALQ